MSLHSSSSVNGKGTSHKDPLSRILDELSSLKLWIEKLERKEKGNERVKIVCILSQTSSLFIGTKDN